MYRYFLGAFGNRSFICPQYEIMKDGSLRAVKDIRWTDLPLNSFFLFHQKNAAIP